jgi:hypothetical protein
MGIARIYKVGSPFNAVELPEVDHVQSFDTMYLAHLNHAPSKLTRQDHASWLFSDVSFGPLIEPPSGVSATATSPNTDADNSGNAYFPQDASYVVTAVSAVTGQESRASDSATANNDLSLKRNYNTVTWSAVTDAARYRVYKANNTGEFGFIGATEELSFRDDFIDADLTVAPPKGANPLASAGDYPSTVTFFEGRLWWGRTSNNPNAMYGSRSQDFENLDASEPLRPDDAISIRLVAQGVNEINQLVPMNGLMAFSSDGIFKIEGSNEDYLSASPPPRQRRQSGRGSSRLPPIVVDNVAFYKTVNSPEVRAAGYNFEVDGVKSDNVCIFSPDLFEGFDIVSWCYAEEPLSVIWAARSDGMLLAFTWEKEQQVWGWTPCPLPNGGKVKSVCSIPEIGAGGMPESRVYGIIEFTIAGEQRLVRCRMASARWAGVSYACHLDCSVTRVFDEPVSVVTGLEYLEGETVAAFVDGVPVEDLLVEDGAITLPEGYEGSVISIGLPYDAEVHTLPLIFDAGGSNKGRPQSVSEVHLALERSRPPLIGVLREGEVTVPANRLRPLKARLATPQSEDASLLSGVYQVTTDPIVSGQASVAIRHRIAPLTVTGVYLDPLVGG